MPNARMRHAARLYRQYKTLLDPGLTDAEKIKRDAILDRWEGKSGMKQSEAEFLAQISKSAQLVKCPKCRYSMSPAHLKEHRCK